MMDTTYWRKQGITPLFDDVLWSLPENKRQAGTLLVVGGNVYGFSIVAETYLLAQENGAGTVRAIMPDALKKFTVGTPFEHEFAGSSHTGTFGKNTLPDIKGHLDGADGILLAGDLGRNSETAKAMADVVRYTAVPTVVTRDTIDYFYNDIEAFNKENIVIVLSFSQLQKLFKESKQPRALTSDMGLVKAVEVLYSFTTKYRCTVVTLHNGSLIVASGGQVSTTKAPIWIDVWRARVATLVAVIAMQYPQSIFEAATTAVHLATNKKPEY